MSLLRTAGLPELVATSLAEYEEVATGLAANRIRLGTLRERLAQRNTALFNTEQYTKNLDAAYVAIYERYRSSLPPEHINEQLAGTPRC
jgi:predicted O-linked N-acetylglucosamine transferase (SPINDLY family)